MTKQYPLPLPHHEAMEADDFLTVSGNDEAVAWIGRWPDWPAHCLVIYGPPGSGKTHLMNVWIKRCGGALLHWKGEGFARYLGQNVALDDADQVVGDAAREETLFHLYNQLNETKGWLLLTA